MSRDSNPVKLKESADGQKWTVVYDDDGEGLDQDGDFVYGDGETKAEALQAAVNCVRDLAVCLKLLVEETRAESPELFTGRFAGLQ